jgi:hypothetical protein
MALKREKEEEEEEYYGVVKGRLSELFEEKGVKVYLEITAKKGFSRELKSKIPSGKEIIFLFLRKAKPDITGFVEGITSPGFVVVEVKKAKIELDDIYQLKKYADLFNASFAFLVSFKPIPEEIRRLSRQIYLLSKLRSGNIYQVFTLAHFDIQNNEFIEWFEENPFTQSIYWR